MTTTFPDGALLMKLKAEAPKQRVQTRRTSLFSQPVKLIVSVVLLAFLHLCVTNSLPISVGDSSDEETARAHAMATLSKRKQAADAMRTLKISN